MANSGDRAGPTFWNSLWAASSAKRAVGSPRLTWVESQFSAVFDAAFRRLGDTRGKKLLEIGCGDSGWLPFFAKHWGFSVSGLDYSPVGCERAATVAASQGVTAEIVCADLFEPPPEMEGRFDAVVSMGVVEHFDDTAGVLRALARFITPGGLLVTTIPNMAGTMGKMFRTMNRGVYDIHVPLDLDALRRAHEEAGLTVVDAAYLMSINLGVINLVGLNPRSVVTRLKHVTLLGMIAFSRGLWILERLIRPLPRTAALSPYLFVIARR